MNDESRGKILFISSTPTNKDASNQTSPRVLIELTPRLSSRGEVSFTFNEVDGRRTTYRICRVITFRNYRGTLTTEQTIRRSVFEQGSKSQEMTMSSLQWMLLMIYN